MFIRKNVPEQPGYVLWLLHQPTGLPLANVCRDRQPAVANQRKPMAQELDGAEGLAQSSFHVFLGQFEADVGMVKQPG